MNNMIVNPEKLQSVNLKSLDLKKHTLQIDEELVETTKSFKFLEINIVNKLTFEDHVSKVM